MWDLKTVLIYLAVISAVSVFITVFDKIAAKKGMYRISERALLTAAAMGGSVAMYLTMLLIRHKTKHLKFMLGIPAIIVLQILLFIFFRDKILK